MKNFKRNAYGRVADTLGIERYQSVPLYLLTDTLVPERYGQDGELTRFIEDGEKFIKAEPMFTGDEWMIPKKYVKVIGDTIVFNKAVFVDRHNQMCIRDSDGNLRRERYIVCSPHKHRPSILCRTLVWMESKKPVLSGYHSVCRINDSIDYIHITKQS